jgi:hypothetical protein
LRLQRYDFFRICKGIAEKFYASPLADSFSQFQKTKATKSKPQYT